MQTVDVTLPYVELTLGETTFKLCMQFAAIARAERELKALKVLPWDQTLLFGNFSRDMTTVPTLFAASLLTYQPETDLAAAVALVDWQNAALISVKVDEAFMQYMPKPTVVDAGTEATAEQQPDPQPPAAETSSGSGSGASPA